MKIAATDQSFHRPVGQSVAHRADQRERPSLALTNDDNQIKKTASVPLVADADVAPVQPRESSESESRGVMRLLQGNHFRGVADVRLRINFFDELSATSASAANAAADSKSQLFLEGVDGALGDFLASLSLDDETMNAISDRIASFDDDVRAALGSNVTASSIDADALGAALRSVFEDLAGEISLLLNPPMDDVVPGPVVDPEEPASDGLVGELGDSAQPAPDVAVEQDEAEPAADSSLTVLIDAFEGFLGDYLSSIESASQLADPAPYDGNGSAYAKFLAIYNDLRGVSSTVDEQV